MEDVALGVQAFGRHTRESGGQRIACSKIETKFSQHFNSKVSLEPLLVHLGEELVPVLREAVGNIH